MSTGRWIDLLGTLKDSLRLGLAGVRLKNSSGNLLVRNTGDSADAEATVSKINISGNDAVLNSDAAGSGADWLYTLRRPSAGMTAAVILTLPPDDGTSGQVLQTDGNGVLTWVSAGSTSLAKKVDTTSLAFGTGSPVAMFTTGAADIVHEVRVIIDTAFTGTPSLSIGISGSTSKYMGATEVDLTMAAGTVFEVNPGLAAQGAEALIGTYAAGGAGAGAARIEVDYSTPA
jgi:hypothetical protein